MKSAYLSAVLGVLVAGSIYAAENVIEKQLQEIGSVPDEQVLVIQRKYTRKEFRHELTPITLGGIVFDPIRNALFGGASYTLHLNDWLAWEAASFQYTKTLFTSFTDDVNRNKINGGQNDIRPDYQKLSYLLTTGFHLTPFYGKMSTFSRWIAYFEPYFILGVGMAKTETDQYLAFVPGIGARIFFREWLSMRLELRDYLYTENFITYASSGGSGSRLRHNWAVMMSLSFWLPKNP